MQVASKGGVIVAGRATRDAESAYVGKNDTLRTKFSMAIGKDADGNTQYANVVAWRGLAEYARGIAKGTSVIVAGTLESRDYNGKTYTDLVADWLNYVDAEAPAAPLQTPDGFVPLDPNDDTLPF